LGSSLVQVAYKNATAVAFNDKIQTFSNTLRDSGVYIMGCIRQPVVQELDKFHVLHERKFCRPTSGAGVLMQSRTAL